MVNIKTAENSVRLLVSAKGISCAYPTPPWNQNAIGSRHLFLYSPWLRRYSWLNLIKAN